MNYRHSHHAGNIADVFKHYVLGLLLAALRAKATPFCVIDTHAGAGFYALTQPGEFEAGIARLWDERRDWPAFAPYLETVAVWNRGGRLKFYPGSPLIIQRALRAQDRAVFLELNPEEYAALHQNLGQARGVALHRQDAWKALAAFVPPRENRGLVLIDPPYERPGDFTRAAEALGQLLGRWRNGLYALWYPVKDRKAVAAFREALGDAGIPKIMDIEFYIRPPSAEPRLDGTGMVVVNPPYQLEAELNTMLPALGKLLAEGPGARWSVEWLAGEDAAS